MLKPFIDPSHRLLTLIYLSPIFFYSLKESYTVITPQSLTLLLFFPDPSVNSGLNFTSLSPGGNAAPNFVVLIFWSQTSKLFLMTLITKTMLLGVMMSINDKPSLFFNSFFIALSECAFQTYFAKNQYNIFFS